MSRIKDYFAPVEEPNSMPQEQEIDEPADQGQQVFAHMICQLTQHFWSELDVDKK